MKNTTLTIVSLAAASVASVASAHISYTNRNFGTLTSTATSINNQTVSSAYGWADATDADWGDTHRTRFFRFNVAADGTYVNITVARNSLGTGAQGTFLPAFSLYSGLAHTSSPLAHDGSALSVNWLQNTFGSSAGFGLGGSGKEGVLNALGNWSIGNSVSDTVIDPSDTLRSFVYVGHAADGTTSNFGAAVGIVGDGLADGFVTATFLLAAGDYSLSVGGADYAAQLSQTGPTYPTYGVDVSVGVVPAPGAVALVAIAGLAGGRRRKDRA
jgi:MYXO-CTERM domain-containing protein